jgi:hypothetical protein
MASLGEVRVEDNLARDCHGGVWLFALGVQSFVSTVGDFGVNGSLDRGTVDNLADELQALFSDDLVFLISVLGRVFPLPVEHPAFDLERLTSIALGGRIKHANRVADTGRFVEEIAAPFAADDDARRQPLTIAEQPAPPAGEPAFLTAARAVNVRLTDADRFLGDAAPAATLRLRVCGNDLDCTSDDRRQTGSALLVYAAFPHQAGSALVSDNRMTGRPPNAIAAIAMVPNAAVNANLIRNENPDLRSLALLGCRSVAVTGNIVLGPALVPPRPGFAPPLDTWSPLNTGM